MIFNGVANWLEDQDDIVKAFIAGLVIGVILGQLLMMAIKSL